MPSQLVALGSSPSTAWRVSTDTVDMTRPVVTPRPVAIAAEPQQVIFDAARTAMIVIDMQNDFCSPKGWLAHIGVDVTQCFGFVAGSVAIRAGVAAR